MTETAVCGRKTADLVCGIPAAVFFAASVILNGATPGNAWYGVLLAMLFLIGRNDLMTGKIRTVHNAVLLLASLPSLYFIPSVTVFERGITFLSMAAALVVTAAACRIFGTRFPIGGGDVRMCGVISLLCGFDAAYAIILAFIAEMVFVLGYVIVRGKNVKDLRGMKIRFGPFLSLGTAVAVLMQLSGKRFM